MALSHEDREHLNAFRNAGKQVREATLIAQGESVTISGNWTPSGMTITARPVENERFRSLAMSVRLVYQSNEPANFGHVCNILARCGDAEIERRQALLRAQYNRTLNEHSLFSYVALDQPALSPREAFETWLYHGAFHQDPSRRADYEALSALGDRYVAAVQSVALQLAGRILDLDDAVADFLGEQRVPRITAARAADAS